MTKNIPNIYNPLMVDYKEIRVKMSPVAHKAVLICAKKMGYSTVSEFVRVAIQMKIRNECYDDLIYVEEDSDEVKD